MSKTGESVHSIPLKLKWLPQGLVVCGMLWGLMISKILIWLRPLEYGNHYTHHELVDAIWLAIYCGFIGLAIGATLHFLVRNPRSRAIIVEATLWLMLPAMILAMM